MRTTLIFLIITFYTPLSYGQIAEVIIDVDTSVFNKKNGNNYLSDSTGATLICMVLPWDYEQTLLGMEDESNRATVITSRGELNGTDYRIYFKKGKIATDNGTIIIEVYAIEYSNKQTIMITGNYREEFKEIIGNQIEVAARSVKRNR